ncbi:MAG: M56 family metallopeptidase [Clostridia bacterium]|nr:M56 family metallopeptidase [Clostridia bacterium]
MSRWLVLLVTLIPAARLALDLARRFRRQLEREEAGAPPEEGRARYGVLLHGASLPAVIGLWLLLRAVVSPRQLEQALISLFFLLTVSLTLHTLLLLPLLPLLRRRISARSCAVLWMLPILLQMLLILPQHARGPQPWLVLTLPEGWAGPLLALWLAGFAVGMGGQLLRHLRFRRHILAPARAVTDPAVLALWQEVQREARGAAGTIPLLISPAVRTPLAIGLFPRTLRVVLPTEDYRAEELRLIFRHEIIHICRADGWNKFFLRFVTALCWFVPTLWPAMRRCAEDLELSCDETVLLGADEDTRRRYAALLLETAGQEAGWTTCLSASAKSLRYRLSRVVRPARRQGGAAAVGLCALLLLAVGGRCVLAYDRVSGEEALFGGDAAAFRTRLVLWEEDGVEQILRVTDEAAFHRWFADLSLRPLTGSYSLYTGEDQLYFLPDGPKGTGKVVVSEGYLKAEGPELFPLTLCYLLLEGVDWRELRPLLGPFEVRAEATAGE